MQKLDRVARNDVVEALSQRLANALRVAASERVDLALLSDPLTDKSHEPVQPGLVVSLFQQLDRRKQILTRHRSQNRLGLQLQDPYQLLLHRRRRGCRERDDLGRRLGSLAGQSFSDRRSLQVLGSEIVPPLAKTVRLIHHEQPNAALEKRLQHHRVQKLLGRQVQTATDPPGLRIH